MTEQSRAAALAGFLATTWAPEGLREDELALIVTALREKAERDAAPVKAGDDLGNGLVAVPREPTEAMIDKGARAIRCGVDPRGCDKWDAMMVYRAMINLVNTAKEPKSDRVSAMIAAAETGT